MLTMPDQLTVPEDLLDTVQWNAVQLTRVVIQVEGKMVVRLEENLSQWHTNNTILNPVIVSNFELCRSELPVPANTTEQFMNRHHREISTSNYLNLIEQYHPCYRAWENPPLDRPLRAREFEAAMAIAARHDLHRLDRRLSHRYPAESSQHPNE